MIHDIAAIAVVERLFSVAEKQKHKAWKVVDFRPDVIRIMMALWYRPKES